MDVSNKDAPKIYCEYCHTQIVGEPVAIRNGFPYHTYHTPEKTAKKAAQAGQTGGGNEHQLTN